jgi:hypothetical protein
MKKQKFLVKTDKDGFFGDEKTFEQSDGSYRGYITPNNKYGLAWKAPNDELGYGPVFEFEDDGFDTPEELNDFMEFSYGNRPVKNLDELIKFNKFANIEQVPLEASNLLYILNQAIQYPDDFEEELSTFDEETLNNPIVQDIIKKFNSKKVR